VLDCRVVHLTEHDADLLVERFITVLRQDAAPRRVDKTGDDTRFTRQSPGHASLTRWGVDRCACAQTAGSEEFDPFELCLDLSGIAVPPSGNPDDTRDSKGGQTENRFVTTFRVSIRPGLALARLFPPPLTA